MTMEELLNELLCRLSKGYIPVKAFLAELDGKTDRELLQLLIALNIVILNRQRKHGETK